VTKKKYFTSLTIDLLKHSSLLFFIGCEEEYKSYNTDAWSFLFIYYDTLAYFSALSVMKKKSIMTIMLEGRVGIFINSDTLAYFSAQAELLIA
jgi:hypothetical protein